MIYNSIKNLPAHVWFAIIKTNNVYLLEKREHSNNILVRLKWFFVSKKDNFFNFIKVKNPYLEKLNSVWESIYDEFLDFHGIDNGAADHVKAIAKIALLKADLITTGNAYIKTLIKIEEKKLETEEKKVENNLAVNLAKLGKYYGYFLDPKTITVDEYYSHLFNAVNGKV